MCGSRMGLFMGEFSYGVSLCEDPGWIITGGSRLVHRKWIQGGFFMGGSRMDHHGRIQGGPSWVDPGWVIMGGSRVGHYGGIEDG